MSYKHSPPTWWKDYDAECAAFRAESLKRGGVPFDDDDDEHGGLVATLRAWFTFRSPPVAVVRGVEAP